MKMGPLRAALVPTVSDEASLFNREKTGWNIESSLPGLRLILMLMNVGCQCWKECIQVGVYRREPIRMPEVDRLTEAKGFDHHFDDGAIGSGQHRKVFFFLGTDIQSHVIVIRAQLSEICRQAHGDVQGIAKITPWVVCRWKDLRRRKEGIKEGSGH